MIFIFRSHNYLNQVHSLEFQVNLMNQQNINIVFVFTLDHTEDLYCFHYTAPNEHFTRTDGWDVFNLQVSILSILFYSFNQH